MARATHRDQSREGSWAARFGCTAVAYLVAMDQATAGTVGPAIDVDDFRNRQPDQDGGIDLRDGRIAAVAYGVPFTVRAAYGARPNPATFDELVEYGRTGAALVIQGDHDRLPGALRCDDYLGDHAVMSRGWRQGPNGRLWDVSNPLCSGWSTWPDDVMRAYSGKLAGTGRAWLAVARPFDMEEPAVLPVTDRTSVRIAVEKGEQLYTLSGAPKIRVSVAGHVTSPFATSIGRVVYVTTGGILQAVVLKPRDGAILPTPHDDVDERALLERIGADLADVQADIAETLTAPGP